MTGTARTEAGSARDAEKAILRTFVRDGRLTRLPARWNRKLIVLRHIAEETFRPGADYSEPEVNEKLRGWCEGGQTDHVTLRRSLVDQHHLRRSDGVYRRADEAA
ncbi:DUF2087 domain-containing protein [Streptomyces sp. BV286]|nr:DUF2087 domain-containing protein [Streptomyces sp. BV286]